MAVSRDLNTIARDLVMKTLDGLAERAASAESAPAPVHDIAGRWRALSETEREDISKRIAVSVEAALAVIPLAAAAVAAARRRTRKRRSPAARTKAAAVAAPEKTGKKDKKDKKDRKKKDKKKDKKKRKKARR